MSAPAALSAAAARAGASARPPRQAALAAVAINLPLDRVFTYQIPAALRAQLMVGARVRVPFGPRTMTGVVVDLPRRAPVARLREIHGCVDAQPLYTPELLALGAWMAERYACTVGEALAVMAPPVTGGRGVALPTTDAAADDSPLSVAFGGVDATAAVDADVASAMARQRAHTWVVQLPPAIRPWEWVQPLVALGGATGRPVIVLVPEIEHVEFLRAAWGPLLGAQAVWLHHAMGDAARRAAWGAILTGTARVIVGTRLAAFAPVRACGALIVLEEHDASYKQDDAPHYHAREVLRERSTALRAPLLLVSGTPSMEARYLVRQRQATWWPVAAPAGAVPPRIHVVDVRAHQGSRGRGWPLLTPPLERAMDQALQHNGRVLLWLNRSGFATRVQCTKCAATVDCPQCSVPLTYFSRPQQLRCRHCAARQPIPSACPQCGGTLLQWRGRGVEKVASEAVRKFPAATLLMDVREPSRRLAALRQQAQRLQASDWQLTVSSGSALHVWPPPAVDVVGAVGADAALGIPDFRAGEHVAQRLWRSIHCVSQRPEARGGVVIFQAMHEAHPLLRAAARGDFEPWYAQELALRRERQLPPWVHLAQLTVRDARDAHAQARATSLAEALRQPGRAPRLTVLGPAPCQPHKLRGQYQWQLLVKARSATGLVRRLRYLLGDSRRWQGQPVTVNVDPV